jgi:serine-type D-Ala-D-Ala carboxypeptidase/endopeptidase
MLDRRTFVKGIAAAAIALAPRTPTSSADIVARNDAIRDILKRRVDVEKRSVGMAICVVTPDRTRFVVRGRDRINNGRPVTSDTVFEIASITKVFTSLLLANMVRRGEMAFDDPVARHLPDDFRVPKLNGREITLADLATHTSGLERMPSLPGELFSPAWRAAIDRYSRDEFKAWLAGEHQSPPPEAGGWWYSNAGYALLGMALAHRGGLPYETLLKVRVIDPIGLRETTFHPTAAMKRRMADSHNKDLTPAAPLALGLFAAAGALRSTARDMARFIRAVLPGSRSRIEAEAQLLLTIRRPAPWIGGAQALGWEVRNAPGGSFVTKDGVSWGQTASIVFDPDKRAGVAVLSNTFPDLAFSHLSSGGVGAADIAHHLLRPQIPMEGQGGTRY